MGSSDKIHPSFPFYIHSEFLRTNDLADNASECAAAQDFDSVQIVGWIKGHTIGECTARIDPDIPAGIININHIKIYLKFQYNSRFYFITSYESEL